MSIKRIKLTRKILSILCAPGSHYFYDQATLIAKFIQNNYRRRVYKKGKKNVT